MSGRRPVAIPTLLRANEEHRKAVILFAAAERSRLTARECARGAAAAALVSIASVVANVAAGLALALVLLSGLLLRRLAWLGRARSERREAMAAEMAASFTASGWEKRTTEWGKTRLIA